MLVTRVEQVCPGPALAPEQTPDFEPSDHQRISLVTIIIIIIKHSHFCLLSYLAFQFLHFRRLSASYLPLSSCPGLAEKVG